MGFIVKCGKCGKGFSNIQARATHIKWIHETPPRKCVVCLKICRDAYDLNRHMKSVHEKDKPGVCFKSCPICSCRINKNCAPEHFRGHGITLETETLKFIDSSAFEQWKTNMEQETNSKFVKQRAPKTVHHGVIINEYCCNRSGKFKSKSRGIRTLKVRGTIKICAYCPATIWTKSYKNGEVIVTFEKTHVGHKNEMGKQLLTKEKARFDSEIDMGVPLLECPQLIPSVEETVLSQRSSSPAQSIDTDITDLEDRKAILVAKFSEIVNSVKSVAGLEALERRMAPLQFIIKSAEKKANVKCPQVSGIVQEQPDKKLIPQRKFYSTEKSSVLKKSKHCDLSLSKCKAIVVSMDTGDVEECSITAVGFDTDFFN